MSLQVSIRAELGNIEELRRHWPDVTQQAINSALKSTGYEGRRYFSFWIRSGGDNWPELHPFTKGVKKRGNVWRRTRRRTGPLVGLARFTRYKFSEEEQAVELKINKSAGSFGSVEKFFAMVARKQEEGEDTPLTAKMRGKLAHGGFVLSKNTTVIDRPVRKIFNPFHARHENTLLDVFKQKFEDRFERRLNA